MLRNSTGDAERLVVLETKVSSMGDSIEKIENKIDKNYTTLHERISNLRDDIHQSIETKHEKLVEKLDDQQKASTVQHEVIAHKVQSLEKWRWMIMGGAMVAGYLLAHLKIDKLF